MFEFSDILKLKSLDQHGISELDNKKIDLIVACLDKLNKFLDIDNLVDDMERAIKGSHMTWGNRLHLSELLVVTAYNGEPVASGVAWVFALNDTTFLSVSNIDGKAMGLGIIDSDEDPDTVSTVIIIDRSEAIGEWGWLSKNVVNESNPRIVSLNNVLWDVFDKTKKLIDHYLSSLSKEELDKLILPASKKMDVLKEKIFN